MKAPNDLFDWKGSTRQEVCQEFKRLDAMFGTYPRSPLHHDNRCPIHSQEGDETS